MRLFATLLLAMLAASSAQATSTIDPTKPADNAPLSSSVVRNNFRAAYNDINALQATALTGNQQITLGGDCTGTGATGIMTTCTKTAGVSFAPSATTDATNASNISSGTLPAARLTTPGASTLGGVRSFTASTNNFLTGIGTDGIATQARPSCSSLSNAAASCSTDATNASNISSGTLPAARLPAPTTLALGGVNSKAAVTSQFLTSIGTDGVVTSAQPSTSDISGLGTIATQNANNVNISGGTISGGAVSGNISGNAANVTGVVAVANGGTGSNSAPMIGVVTAANQGAARTALGLAAVAASGSASDLTTGTLPTAQLPNPSATTLGGVKSLAAVTNRFLTSIGTDGLPVAAQPTAGDISGLAASATTDTTRASNISSGTLAVARGGTGTGTAFTAGSVVFAGASGVYSQDNAALFWDAANKRLGLGTATPQKAVEISAVADPTLRLSEGSSTTSYFDIIDYSANAGKIRKITNSGSSILYLEPTPSDGTSVASVYVFRDVNSSGKHSFSVFRGDGTNAADHTLYAGNSGASALLANNGGTVGIGMAGGSTSFTLGFGGDAVRTIGVERATSGAGNTLTVQSGGAESGSTDTNGGDLNLSAGISSGSGASNINLRVTGGGTTGTTTRNPTTIVTVSSAGVGIGSTSTGGFLVRANSSTTNSNYDAYYTADNSSGPLIQASKYRGSGIEAAANDIIMQLRGRAVSGAGASQYVSEVRLVADAANSAGSSPGRIQFLTTASGATTVTERARIDSKGHLEWLGTAPAVTAGAADCGTSPAIVGNDNVGRVTVGSSTNGGKCTVTFAAAWSNAPICQCNNETAGVLCAVKSVSTSSMALTGVLVAGDAVNYSCVGYR